MTRIPRIRSFAVLLAMLVGSAQAGKKGGGGGGGRGIAGPCGPVWRACVTTGKRGKAAQECVEKIKNGEDVDGVVVTEADLETCRASASQSEGKANSNVTGQ